MKLIVSDARFRAPAEEMLITLLPSVEIEYSDDIPEYDDYLSVRIRCAGKTASAAAKARIGGRDFTGSSRRSLGETQSQANQAQSRAVKYASFRAVTKATGVKPPWGSLTGVRPSKIALALMKDGLTDGQIETELWRRYEVRAGKRRLLIKTAKEALRAQGARRQDEVSLYVGIPFCPTRCAYCSFISTSAANSKKLIPEYLAALEKEAAYAGKRLKELGQHINTLYIGGGTPTALTAAELLELLDTLRENFDLSGLREFTIEAGRPDTIDREKLLVMRDFGADRISINPQTMDDALLARIGRNHSADDIRRAYAAAREVGGFAVNMDLIAGLPGDTLPGFLESLRGIIAMSPENITVHNLAIKKGAALSDKKRVGGNAPLAGGMIDGAFRRLIKAGYSPYYTYRQKYTAGGLENTGFAKEGTGCLYNIYIMEEIQSIWSLGAGGVSKFVDGGTGLITRRINPKYPAEYIRSIAAGENRAAEFFADQLGRKK